MKETQLTLAERTILIHLLEIRKALEATTAYDRQLAVLQNGYSIFYKEVLVEDDEVSEADCKFVIDVLQMYRVIECHKRETGDSLEHQLLGHFCGFDGNDESALMAFARFEIEQRGRWDEHKAYAQETDSFNSHLPMRATYQRMLAVYRALPQERRSRPTKNDVTAILTAARL